MQRVLAGSLDGDGNLAAVSRTQRRAFFAAMLAELRDLVILVDLRAAVSGEGVLSHLPVLLRHRLSVESLIPSSLARSTALISPPRTTRAAAILNRLSQRVLFRVV